VVGPSEAAPTAVPRNLDTTALHNLPAGRISRPAQGVAQRLSIVARVSATTRNRVAVLHGVNFDVLDRRNPELYGGRSLSELEHQIEGWARAAGLEPLFFQTNHEGEFVEYLHRLPDLADGSLINAGAWTHYSRAIADALDVTGLPAVEVHLSDVEAREDWRKVSVFDGLVVKKISGKGAEGYREALEVLARELGVKA
jgi:3-dehydroquinate dehydratase II